jgi:hypothetical protein
MDLRQLALALALPATLTLTLACDSGGAEPKPDPVAEAKAKEKEESKARTDKRRKEREEQMAAEEQEKKDIAAKIIEISVIPEGTKLPKKIADACEQVVTAQSGMMKKLYPQVDDAALTTQLGMLRKQCLEANDIEMAMCQKFALDATTEQLKSMINEYLPACMAKYGEGAAAQPAPG